MDAIFVTSTYPFGEGETFIENEIEYLAEAFDNVYIYPCNSKNTTNMRPCPKNVIIHLCESKEAANEKYRGVFEGRLYWECFRQIGRKRFLGRCASALYLMSETKRASRCIDEFLDDLHLQRDSHVVIYSYWLSNVGMTALNIKKALRIRGVDANAVSRCHGYDLYEERAYRNYLPFQEYMLAKFDRIYPCSQNGTEYLKKKYPQYSDKIETAYLGIPDHFHGRWPIREPFIIVSCSNVNEVKRVIKIAEALKAIRDVPVHWVHFGDGPLFEQLKEYVKTELPANITVELPGRVDNSDIYTYYQEHNVSLFINVSSTEGLPVSIMEACSFGIPVIATDVGGTKEIVTDGKNGRLCKDKFTNEELRTLILQFLNMKAEKYLEYNRYAREIYFSEFSAEKNYNSFYNLLKRV